MRYLMNINEQQQKIINSQPIQSNNNPKFNENKDSNDSLNFYGSNETNNTQQQGYAPPKKKLYFSAGNKIFLIKFF